MVLYLCLVRTFWPTAKNESGQTLIQSCNLLLCLCGATSWQTWFSNLTLVTSTHKTADRQKAGPWEWILPQGRRKSLKEVLGEDPLDLKHFLGICDLCYNVFLHSSVWSQWTKTSHNCWQWGSHHHALFHSPLLHHIHVQVVLSSSYKLFLSKEKIWSSFWHILGPVQKRLHP